MYCAVSFITNNLQCNTVDLRHDKFLEKTKKQICFRKRGSNIPALHFDCVLVLFRQMFVSYQSFDDKLATFLLLFFSFFFFLFYFFILLGGGGGVRGHHLCKIYYISISTIFAECEGSSSSV